jgi:hypothetical protein
MRVLEDSPGPLFSLAAFGAWNFDAILARVGAKPTIRSVKSFGKVIDRYRSIFFQFDSGRYASITKYDSQAEFEIAFQRVNNRFYDRELQILLDFVGMDESDVQRYRNPPIRYVAHPPSDFERTYWLKRVGSEYPY